MSNGIINDIEKSNHSGFPLFSFTGKALEKAGGKEFLETVKELRKSQGPLEVAEGKCELGLYSLHSLTTSLSSFTHNQFAKQNMPELVRKLSF